MIGFWGFISRYLGKDKRGIHLPSVTSIASSGVNGFRSIPEDLISECSFSWAQKEILSPCFLR